MFSLKRSAIALSSVLTVGLIAAVALSTTAPGAAALRLAAGKLSVAAHAAGGGGGGTAGVDGLTIGAEAPLVAKLAASVTVSYMCQPVFDPTTGNFDILMSSSEFAFVEERTGGKTTASGQGVTNGTAVCDEGLTPTPTVNQATILVLPNSFPASGPFKNGTAIATAQVVACPISFNASGFPPPCDFGSVGPTVISIG